MSFSGEDRVALVHCNLGVAQEGIRTVFGGAAQGGMPGAERLRDSSMLTQILEKQKAGGRFWTAICASPAVVFESKGWLAGKKATAHPAFADKLSDPRFDPTLSPQLPFTEEYMRIFWGFFPIFWDLVLSVSLSYLI